jgi:predicted AAA+ superfamily ATPase
MEISIQTALEKQNPWWFDRKYDTGIPRLVYYPNIAKHLRTKEIQLILGARRTGKSTLLYQIINSLKITPQAVLFINLDEPLFQSKADNPEFLGNLIEDYIVQHKNIKKIYVFIDEIQNYNFWVQTIKTLHDVSQNIKFILTGSTSTLIESKMSTRLSGRYFSTVVYPLSFQEFLIFNEVNKPTLSEQKYFLQEYLKYGAFPRVVLEKDKTLKQEILKNYFQTIYLKDIVYPHKIRNNKDVFDLLYFVLSNAGKLLSYNSIAKTLGMAVDTVKEYLEYARQAYLLFSIPKFDYSVKKQLANPKKMYCLDTGLINMVSFQFSENKGRILENLVYLILRKKYEDIFYHKDGGECDFVVKEGLKIKQAIQVTLSLRDPKVREREIKGLINAMNAYNLKEGLIITEGEKEIIKQGKKIVHVKPIYEWLLNEDLEIKVV